MKTPSFRPGDLILLSVVLAGCIRGGDARVPQAAVEAISQSPFRFSAIVALSSIAVTFSAPVEGVAAADLSVNGSPSTKVVGRGAGPYEFVGFDPPAIGLVTVELRGRGFAPTSWTYTLVDPARDSDGDGLNDGEEATRYRTDPTRTDTDADGLPDRFEALHACLDPIVDERRPLDYMGRPLPGDHDADDDGQTNMEELAAGTDPCSAASK